MSWILADSVCVLYFVGRNYDIYTAVLLVHSSASCLYPIAELRELLQFVTGCPSATGNTIAVVFDEDSSVSASANTCARELRLSLCISDKEQFFGHMFAVIEGTSFTMT